MHPIKAFRQDRRMTLQQLADRLNRSRSAVNAWELMQRFPSPVHVADIERITDGEVTAEKLHTAWRKHHEAGA